METAGVEPAPPRCKRGAHPHELHPQDDMRTGGVEPPQHWATGLQPAELAGAQRPQGEVAGRDRTDAARITTANAAATPRPPWMGPPGNGDDRIRTGGLSPDKRALCAPELRPPTRRRAIAPAGVEPASRAHEARGTAVSPRRSLAGWSRTSGLRFPKPAGCPSSLQPVGAPPAGLEPALPG